jgi:hypothetical protein
LVTLVHVLLVLPISVFLCAVVATTAAMVFLAVQDLPLINVMDAILSLIIDSVMLLLIIATVHQVSIVS